MKLFRLLGFCSLLILALAGLVVAALFSPDLQAWYAQSRLEGVPGTKITIGSLSARPHTLTAGDVHIEREGASLALPSLYSELPLISDLEENQAHLTTLVAKGWTLDLTHYAGLSPKHEASEAGEKGPEARVVVGFLGTLLQALHLPQGVIIERLDTEGDILVPSSPGESPARLHVSVSGGQIGPNRHATLSLSTTVVDHWPALQSFSATGPLDCRFAATGSLETLSLRARVTQQDRPADDPLNFSASLDRVAPQGFSFALARGSRSLISFSGRVDEAGSRMTGAWTLAVTDADLNALGLEEGLPKGSAKGTGTLEASKPWDALDLKGSLDGVVSDFGSQQPTFGLPLPLSFATSFRLSLSADTLRLQQTSLTLSNGSFTATARTLQPVDLHLPDLGARVPDPAADGLALTLRNPPIPPLKTATSSWKLDVGGSSGSFLVKFGPDAVQLRSSSPARFEAVTLSMAGTPMVGALSLSSDIMATRASGTWKLTASSKATFADSRSLGDIELVATHPSEPDKPSTLTGNWSADLNALLTEVPALRAGGLSAAAAQGDYSLTFGPSLGVESTIKVQGHNPGHSATLILTADLEPDQSATFNAPLVFSFDSDRSDLTLDGSLSADAIEPHLDAKLSGQSVDLEHLKLLLGPLAAAAHIELPQALRDGPAAATVSAKQPSWGGHTGVLHVSIDHLLNGKTDLKNVGGSIVFDPTSLDVLNGRVTLPPHNLATFSAKVAFDRSAVLPYSVSGQGEVEKLDAKSLFQLSSADDNPPIEGLFDLGVTFKGSSRDFDGLLRGTDQSLHLKSSTGILRLLKVDVADSIPQIDSPVKDALGSVGSAVGSFFGVNKDPGASGRNPVSKTAEAVLEFCTRVSEIGFDHLDLQARRNADDSFVIEKLSIEGPEEVITGTGTLASAPGKALSKRPLSLDLRLGLKGLPATFLARAEVIPKPKDGETVTFLPDPVHIEGDLTQPDVHQWHDFLAKKANPPPPPKKS